MMSITTMSKGVPLQDNQYKDIDIYDPRWNFGLDTKIKENDMEPIALRTHRESMKYELNQGLCEVTFTKVDGDERIMTCTTDLGAIPEGNRPKGTGKEPKANAAIPVWDINAEGWRSFKSESVTKFKALRYSDGKVIEKLLDI